MNWTALVSDEQLEQIREESKIQPVLIFKHSTSCNISRMALGRLERNWKTDEVAPIKTYFLDLLSHRALSRSVASFFNVEHESPQMLIVRDGKAIQVTSHMAIDFEQIRSAVHQH